MMVDQGSEERKTVIIHSTRTAIALVGIWVDLWWKSTLEKGSNDSSPCQDYRLVSV